MDIQWYPGHMAKATRLIKEQLKNIDVVLIAGDARCTQASVNVDFLPIVKNKRLAYVFNKADLADERALQLLKQNNKDSAAPVFFTDCISKKGLNDIKTFIRASRESFRFTREVRVLIAGIPNVGKSMLINSLAKRASAPTANTPGFTKANKWVHVSDDFYLLDSPGILPPKFSTQRNANILSAVGCVKDTIFDKGELSLFIIEFLSENYPEQLMSRYKLSEIADTPVETMEAIGKSRGFMIKGGEVDYERCAHTITDEFKNGKIGRISFDLPKQKG